MKNEILNELHNPRYLEELYRDNKLVFKRGFYAIYPEIESFLAGLIAKLPEILNSWHCLFYPQNLVFVVLSSMIAYFAWKNRLKVKTVLAIAVSVLVSLIFINVIPGRGSEPSDTYVLSCIYMPIFFWSIVGFSYSGRGFLKSDWGLSFLRFNGVLVVIITLILISEVILTYISVVILSCIDMLDIYDYFVYFCFVYFENTVVINLTVSAIVGTYIIETNPRLISKVIPPLVESLNPLILIALVICLISLVSSGISSYNMYHDVLLPLLNILLIVVMAIIVFGISSIRQGGTRTIWIFFFLISLVTITLNCITLSAIILQISERGITPNRLAVLGNNLLILSNLVIVCYGLIRAIRIPDKIDFVYKAISRFLPIYCFWAIVVTFIFPFIFHFK